MKEQYGWIDGQSKSLGGEGKSDASVEKERDWAKSEQVTSLSD